jgi:NodT family efflux transporter outer membrane factor (OMF) lipoprotein
MARRVFGGALVALALCACTAGPDYVAPKPPSRALGAGAFLRADAAEAAQPAARWWEGLDDPQLTALIARGLRDSPSVARMQARLRQARAELAMAKAAPLPSVAGSALYAHADLPPGTLGTNNSPDLFQLGFDARWEADLWGGDRRGIEAARARAEAAKAAIADAQVSLSAEIARSYVSLRAREADATLLEARRGVEARLVELSSTRFRGGSAPRQPLEAALLQQRQTEVEQALAAAEISALRDNLAVLTGAAPGALDDLAPAAVPLPPARVAVGDPAALLARRPDIRAAERQLAAANAEIGVETARRFPQVSLMGLIGIGGTSASDLFDTSQLSTIGLPRLSWSFLDFGRNAARVHGAEAARDAALADYDATVLGALQDAEAALARYGAARAAFAGSAERAQREEEIARLQRLRAAGGTLAPPDALQAERDAIGLRLAESHDRAALTLAYVSLAKALGLGWEPPPAQPH